MIWIIIKDTGFLPNKNYKHYYYTLDIFNTSQLAFQASIKFFLSISACFPDLIFPVKRFRKYY
uniref:Uncharacterized protein n=1 Tax=uncultured Desulfobacterium sp. TaxID=201089 RepID=E1YEY2_9BACT|nr:unknown protein [uncultured Desulfobacterium sp.]